EEDSFLFDGTSYLQYGDLTHVSTADFRYGLRLITGNDRLTRFPKNRTEKVSYQYLITPYEGDFDLYYFHEKEVHFFNFLANKSIHLFQKYGMDRLRQEMVMPNLRIGHGTVLTAPREKRKDRFRFATDRPHAIFKERILDFHETLRVNDSTLSLRPTPIDKWLEALGELDSAEYVSLWNLDEGLCRYKVVNETGLPFLADTLTFTQDWLHFTKQTWQAGDTIYADFRLVISEKDVSYARYTAVLPHLDKLIGRLNVLWSHKIDSREDTNGQTRVDWLELIGRIIQFTVLCGLIIWMVPALIDWRKARKKKPVAPTTKPEENQAGDTPETDSDATPLT
ncbi:MAG: hypothetical protein AAF206_17515, partial [Bacteroidota bacterium]